MAGVLVVTAAACSDTPPQLEAVKELMARSDFIRIACLDLNDDRRVDRADADIEPLPDLTGDGAIDDVDAEIVRGGTILLSEQKPAACAEGEQPDPDWQVTGPPEIDCASGEKGLIFLGVGGGVAQLRDPEAAAGVRWMLQEIGEALSDEGVPSQAVSVAPGVNGSPRTNADAETWAASYLSVVLRREPCMRAVLLGHSHGGAVVTATAARLEEAGLGDRILLVVLIDRVTVLYGGDARAIPQGPPVFNVYLDTGSPFEGAPIQQANVENWDATGEKAPQDGEQGGTLRPANHTTIDNAPSVFDQVAQRVLSAARGL